MKTIRMQVVVICFIVGAMAARGQDTLEQWIAVALEKNPALASARKSWEAAQQRLPQVRAFDDPTIGGDVERSGTTRFDTFTDIEWTISQKVPWFGKRGTRALVEQGIIGRAEHAYRAKQLEIISLVKRAFCDVWQAQRELDLNDRHQALLEQFVQLVATQYQVGKASQMDALKARIAAAKLSEERFDRQRTLQKARASINSLVNRPPDSPIVMALPDLTPPMSPVTFDTLSRTALERRPELLEIQRGSVVSANASLALAKKVYEPDFEFRIEARQFNGHSGIQEYDTGVFLNFPWLNAARNRAVIAEARAQVERNAAEYETVRVQTMEAIQQSYDGIQTMHHHYELFASSILPLQRAAVEAARAGYETNETTLADLIEAQRMLLDAEMQQLHHIGEFHRLRAELERLVGGDLPTKESQK